MIVVEPLPRASVDAPLALPDVVKNALDLENRLDAVGRTGADRGKIIDVQPDRRAQRADEPTALGFTGQLTARQIDPVGYIRNGVKRSRCAGVLQQPLGLGNVLIEHFSLPVGVMAPRARGRYRSAYCAPHLFDKAPGSHPSANKEPLRRFASHSAPSQTGPPPHRRLSQARTRYWSAQN